MTSFDIELGSVGSLRKYLRVLTGKYAWNSNLYGCVDHRKISPRFEAYLRSCSGGLQSEEYPRLVFRNLRSIESVQSAIHTLDDSSNVEHAIPDPIISICDEELSRFESEESLLEYIESENWYLYFPGKHHRVYVYASLLVLREAFSALKALELAEHEFDTSLKCREIFVSQWSKK